jgi:hypothetical protein
VEIGGDQNSIDGASLHTGKEFVCRETSFSDQDVTRAAEG